MDPTTRTSLLTLISTLLAAVTRAFNDDTHFATITKQIRAIILAGIAIAQTAIDSLVQGTAIQLAVLGAVATTGPSFLILVIEYWSDRKGAAKGDGGTGGPTAGSRKPQDATYSTKMVPLLLGAALALVACDSCKTAPNGAPFKWPDTTRCAPGVGNLVGELTQLLLSDAGVGDVTPTGKAKIEELAVQYGAESVLCTVSQLSKAWLSPAASPSKERVLAAARAQGFLDSLPTKIETPN